MENAELTAIQALLETSTSTQTSTTTSSSSSSAQSHEKHEKIRNFLSVIEKYSDTDFKRHFRVKRHIAMGIIERYSQSYIFQLKLVNKSGCRKLKADEEVYMLLWYLANTEPYRTLANIFGVSTFTAWKVVDRVVTFLVSIGHEYIKWPNNLTATCNSFERIAGIPRVVGAIDCSDVKIKAPLRNKEDYYNRKKYYSLKLQAVVNSEKVFMDISVGEPGSLHYSRALRRSSLYHKIQRNGTFFGERNFILGDSAYPCTSWLITPYKNDGNLSRSQKKFNSLHSSTRVVVENAFGLLKTRFRRVQFFTEHNSLSFVVNLITATCVLHNICMTGDDIEVELNETLEVTDNNIVSEENESVQGRNRREELFQEMQLLSLI